MNLASEGSFSAGAANLSCETFKAEHLPSERNRNSFSFQLVGSFSFRCPPCTVFFSSFSLFLLRGDRRGGG